MTNGTTTAGVRGPGGNGLPASRAVAVAAARAASDKQADDIVVLDVSDVIVITDFFVLCTASSSRQVKTVIEAVEDAIRTLGVRPVRREGEADAGWWLLDYVDVVVHVFGTEEREYYDLERLWRDAPALDWEHDAEAASGA
ncbi:MAG TPA: ribosome silencing factor [Actinomycetota bacterium]|nr:ribosome silencing factor [Actinomycetota bacterium]